jgi:hypothetical protein
MRKIATLKHPGAKLHPAGAWTSATSRAVALVILSIAFVVTTASSVSGTQSVTLAWNPVTNANVAGYKIYYGSASGNYTNVTAVGNVTNAAVSGLRDGTTYYFATTTLSTSGSESAYSSEVPYTVPNASSAIIIEKVTASTTNPVTLQFCTNMSSGPWWTAGTFTGSTNLSFTNLPAVFIRGVCNNLTSSVTLTWAASTSISTMGYKVYYGSASGIYTSVLTVGKVTTATISNLTPGQRYYFLVDTYNPLGVVSTFLSETSATAPIPSFTLSIGH